MSSSFSFDRQEWHFKSSLLDGNLCVRNGSRLQVIAEKILMSIKVFLLPNHGK